MKKTISMAGFAMTFTVAQSVMAQDDSTQQRLDELQAQIDVLVSELEQGMTADASRDTSIGGYGELHYNNLDSGDEIDFHRFVLFFGHEFTDRVRFFSEVELEHSLAGEGKEGEVELEQAYIEYDLSQGASAKAGLFLVPVGILNETHEPPTFYGVERNGVESQIIPSTWWEAGAAFSGRYQSGVSYDLAVHSGLKVPTEGGNAYSIRSGRQKVSEAAAEDLAYTGRLRYTGIAGLELSATLQAQSDITQGADDADAILTEVHAVYRSGPFGLRALYANWDIDSIEAEALGKDSQYGYYVEPSFRLNDAFGFFARYGEFDTTDGLSDSEATEQLTLGLNWYLHENVVVKFDVQDQSGVGDDDGFNIGVGYQF